MVEGYNEETDRRVTAKEMNDAIAKAVSEIRSRNYELETEITQKNMKIRHLEELIREKNSALKPKPPLPPGLYSGKEIDDEQ